jgi:MSHA pilin protein MshA
VNSTAGNATASITLEGVPVAMAFGYPTAASIATAAGISADDYTVDTSVANKITVSPKGVATVANCSVVYTAATSLTSPATVVLQTGTTGTGTGATVNANPNCS